MKRITVVAATVVVAVGGVLGIAGVASATSVKHAAVTPAVKAEAIAAFKKAGCAGCHTLAAAGALGTRGPNLDGLFFPAADIVRQVTNGGSYMPAFGTILSKRQIQSLAAWIDAVRLVKDPNAAAATTAGTKTTATKPAATTATAAPAALTPAVKALGIAAFKKAGCAGCHALAAQGALGTRGPNLDGLYFPVADIIRQVTNGGSYMPGFGTVLSAAQIKAVAAYIDAVRLVKKS